MGTTEEKIVKKPNRFLQVTGEVVHEIAGKLPSRKLAVWTAATVAFFLDKLPPDLWIYVSLAFLGSQAILDYGKAKFSS